MNICARLPFSKCGACLLELSGRNYFADNCLLQCQFVIDSYSCFQTLVMWYYYPICTEHSFPSVKYRSYKPEHSLYSSSIATLVDHSLYTQLYIAACELHLCSQMQLYIWLCRCSSHDALLHIYFFTEFLMRKCDMAHQRKKKKIRHQELTRRAVPQINCGL